MLTRARHRLATWIAPLAIVLGALAPTVSHAVSAARGDFWMPLCTAQGAKFIRFGATQPDAAPPGAQQAFDFAHCPLCSSPGMDAALPSAAGGFLAWAPAQAEGASPVPAAPHLQSVWTPAQTRAPPAAA